MLKQKINATQRWVLKLSLCLLLGMSAVACTQLEHIDRQQDEMLAGTTAGAASGAAVGGLTGLSGLAVPLGIGVGAAAGASYVTYESDQYYTSLPCAWDDCSKVGMLHTGDKIARLLGTIGVQVVNVGDERRIILPTTMFFIPDSADLRHDALPVLNLVAQLIERYGDVKMIIFGNTNNIPNKKDQKNISTAQAQTIADYLVKQGVPEANIRVVGVGSQAPVATNLSSSGRGMNSRVVIATNLVTDARGGWDEDEGLFQPGTLKFNWDLLRQWGVG